MSYRKQHRLFYYYHNDAKLGIKLYPSGGSARNISRVFFGSASLCEAAQAKTAQIDKDGPKLTSVLKDETYREDFPFIVSILKQRSPSTHKERMKPSAPTKKRKARRHCCKSARCAVCVRDPPACVKQANLKHLSLIHI